METKVLTSLITANGKIVGDYLLTKVIGRGRFGMVYLAKHAKTGQVYAAKQLKKSELSTNEHLKRLLITEVTVMNDIKHPNILHLYDFLESKENFYLIVNYCNQGSLEDYLANNNSSYFKEDSAVFFLRQIANAFVELRKKKILHRDLKLDNIFLHNNQIVIGDFGFAKIGQEYAESKLGSPGTMAYELLTASSQNCIYNSKADLWSIGVVFYQMLAGKPPFYGFTMKELITDIERKANGKLEYPRKVSKESQNLIDRILVTNPMDRMDWFDFFNHDIFEKSKLNLKTSWDVKSKSTGIETPPNDLFLQSRNFAKKKEPVTFLDFQSFIDEYNGQTMTAKTIKESNLVQTLGQNKLQNAFVNFEKRIKHEKSLSDFFINTYKKIRHCIKEEIYPSLTTSLYNIMALILKKIHISLNFKIKQFEKKRNVFKMESSIFGQITQTIEYWDLLEELKKLRSRINGYLKYINEKTREQGIDLVDAQYVFNQQTTFTTVNGLINLSYKNLKSKMPSQLNPEDENDKYLSFILLLIKCCMNSEKIFLYIDPGTKKEGFNWNKFYTTLKEKPVRDK